MASPKANKTADEIRVDRQARRAAAAATTTAWRWTTSSSTFRSARSSPTPTGLHRATLQAIRMIGIGSRPLPGIHIMGGLTNIGQQLPPKAADGSDLKLSLECAFLTLAVPLGFDTVLATPWRGHAPVAGGQLRARTPTTISWSRPARMRCAPCASSTRRDCRVWPCRLALTGSSLQAGDGRLRADLRGLAAACL